MTPWVTRDGAYRFALKGGAARAAGLMSRETTMQLQLVVTTSDPPSTVVYVEPTQGETVSGVTPVRRGTGRDRLDRCAPAAASRSARISS